MILGWPAYTYLPRDVLLRRMMMDASDGSEMFLPPNFCHKDSIIFWQPVRPSSTYLHEILSFVPSGFVSGAVNILEIHQLFVDQSSPRITSFATTDLTSFFILL